MTIAAVPALRPRREPSTTGMLWATWRQHRVALVGVLGTLAALAVLLLITGHAMDADARRFGVVACIDSTTNSCQAGDELFRRHWDRWAQLPQLLMFTPAVVGTFLGAPLVARELETGTFRFAWTQGVSRRRWLAVRVLALGGTVTLGALGFSVLFAWWWSPLGLLYGRMSSGHAYEVEGLVFAARTLFAFAVGVLVGAVLRRVVAAIAATGALWFATVWSETLYLRQQIQAPITTPRGSALAQDPGSWTLQQWIQDQAGHHVSDSDLNTLAKQFSGTGQGSVSGAPRQAGSLFDILTAHGYSMWDSVEPGNRFWHFQLVESGAYTVIALVLIGAAAVVVSRRS